MSTTGPNERQLKTWLVGRVAELLRVGPETVAPSAVFSELGLSSVQGVELAAELEDLCGREIPATLVYEYPTIEDAAHYAASL